MIREVWIFGTMQFIFAKLFIVENWKQWLKPKKFVVTFFFFLKFELICQYQMIKTQLPLLKAIILWLVNLLNLFSHSFFRLYFQFVQLLSQCKHSVFASNIIKMDFALYVCIYIYIIYKYFIHLYIGTLISRGPNVWKLHNKPQ